MVGQIQYPLGSEFTSIFIKVVQNPFQGSISSGMGKMPNCPVGFSGSGKLDLPLEAKHYIHIFFVVPFIVTKAPIERIVVVVVKEKNRKTERNNIMCMSDHRWRPPAAAASTSSVRLSTSCEQPLFSLMMTSFVTTAQSIYRGDA